MQLSAKNISYVITELPDLDGDTLDTAIAKLRQFSMTLPPDAKIDWRTGAFSDTYRYYVLGTRIETDAELAKRQGYEDQRLANERATYDRLRSKFEG